MPEEKPVVEDQILAQLSRLDEKLEARFQSLERGFEIRFDALEQRMARLEGGFEQMDKRVTNVELLQRWVLGIMITSWLTLLGLTVTILAKLL